MSAGGLNLERILVAFLWVGRVSHWERTVASYRSRSILVTGAEQSSQAALTVRTLGAIRSCGSCVITHRRVGAKPSHYHQVKYERFSKCFQHGYVKTWGNGRSDLEVSITCAAW